MGPLSDAGHPANTTRPDPLADPLTQRTEAPEEAGTRRPHPRQRTAPC